MTPMPARSVDRPSSNFGRRRRGWPWIAAGLLAGALVTLIARPPASWLAAALHAATGGRLLLADTRGSLWSGSAVLVLTGGEGSRDASALPGRMKWTFGLAREDRRRIELRLRHACCIDDQLRLRIEPGIGRLRIALPPERIAVGHWPAAWLSGLGTPFNSLQLGGVLEVSSEGLAVEAVQGRWRVAGRAAVELRGMSSRLSTLDRLGSWRLAIGATEGQEAAALELTTLQGPLQLSGAGQWAGTGLRFRGEARAEPGSEPVLNNLLNIIGRRQGALAILSIG